MTLSCALEIDELKPHLLARLKLFTKQEKEQVIARHPRLEFVTEAIDTFETVRGYRAAEAFEQNVLLPLCSSLQAADVNRILPVAEANGQINEASGTPAFMVEMFERTADLRAATCAAWQRFLAKMQEGKSADEYYAYPELRARME